MVPKDTKKQSSMAQIHQEISYYDIQFYAYIYIMKHQWFQENPVVMSEDTTDGRTWIYPDIIP